MSEVIDLRYEEAIPELESMLLLLFEKDDVQAILKSRREFECKIHRPQKRKEDCVAYIKSEMKLMRMISIRMKRKNIQKDVKLLNLEAALGRRLSSLFMLTIRWFPEDVRLWVAYIRFCKQVRHYAAISRVLEQMLELHGASKPDLFKMAASLELKECDSLEKARKYLIMGIHKHKDNKMLLTEAFKLELIDADRKRREYIEKNIPIDPSNIQLTSKKAESIYDCSIKKMNDVELLNDLVMVCYEYDFTSELANKINVDLMTYSNDERMWDIIALRELSNNSDEKTTIKTKLRNCVKIYDAAVKAVNTTQMYVYYLNALLELSKDTSVLPNYKRKLLMSALQRGATAGKLPEKYYLIWAEMFQEPEKHKKLIEMLQCAVQKLPDSAVLWRTLLKAHLDKNEDKQANQVLDQAVAALNEDSLPLWKLMLQYEQTKKTNKVEDIYKKSLNQCPQISNALKPWYLEWLVLTHGIVVARKTYDSICQEPPLCLEMHKRMIYLETIQPTVNKKRIRVSYTMACAQFGNSDVDVWMDFCKFELHNGDTERMNEIYWGAKKNLSLQMFETFLSEFSLIRPIPEEPMVTQ